MKHHNKDLDGHLAELEAGLSEDEWALERLRDAEAKLFKIKNIVEEMDERESRFAISLIRRLLS